MFMNKLPVLLNNRIFSRKRFCVVCKYFFLLVICKALYRASWSIKGLLITKDYKLSQLQANILLIKKLFSPVSLIIVFPSQGVR